MNKNLEAEITRQRHTYPKSQSHFLRNFPREASMTMIRPALKAVKTAIQVSQAMQNPALTVSGIIERLL
jgi:DNA-binding helix-hairpin-helix protein with protein kinase domain